MLSYKHYLPGLGSVSLPIKSKLAEESWEKQTLFRIALISMQQKFIQDNAFNPNRQKPFNKNSQSFKYVLLSVDYNNFPAPSISHQFLTLAFNTWISLKCSVFHWTCLLFILFCSFWWGDELPWCIVVVNVTLSQNAIKPV